MGDRMGLQGSRVSDEETGRLRSDPDAAVTIVRERRDRRLGDRMVDWRLGMNLSDAAVARVAHEYAVQSRPDPESSPLVLEQRVDASSDLGQTRQVNMQASAAIHEACRQT